MNCPKCDADISDSYEPDDWSVGISAGWFCDACDLAIADDGSREALEDVAIGLTGDGTARGTPISELSGRPGEPGFGEFCRIAKSWGYD